MLSRAHRFHGHSSLRFVYTRGKTVRTPVISLKYHLNNRRKTYRAAVVVSKKTAKSAVVRNRIRRRIYATLRNLLSESTPAYDLVVTVFDDRVAKMLPEKLTKELMFLLDQAGVISPKPQHSQTGEHDKIGAKE